MKPPLTGKKFDDIQTPAYALKPLYPFLQGDWIIWECAQGKGNLSSALRQGGYTVASSDILTGEDFLTWEPRYWDCIVTNPPYSLKQKFLARAYHLGKPFAFLLPLTTLETQERQAMFRVHGVEIVLFDRRVNFEIPPGVIPDHRHLKSKSWFATAWFTNGLKIGQQLTFCHLSEDGHVEVL